LLRSLSRELGCVLVCGLAELGADGAVYNSAVVVERGVLRTCYRKVHLWGREAELFTAASQSPDVIETTIGKVAVVICYDLEFPEWVGRAALAGADILAVPANWPQVPRPADERPLEVIKAQAAAATWRVHVVVADRCGPERGVDWIGGSVICASTGFLVAGPPTPPDAIAERAVLTAELDPAAARNKSLGPYNDAFADRRPDLYR
jgi:predicted amidohydrolase